MVKWEASDNNMGFFMDIMSFPGPSCRLIKQHRRHLWHLRRSSSSLLNKHDFW